VQTTFQKQTDESAQTTTGVEHAIFLVGHEIGEAFAVANLRVLDGINRSFFRRDGRVIAVAVIQKSTGKNLAVKFQARIIGGLVTVRTGAQAARKRLPISGVEKSSGNTFRDESGSNFFLNKLFSGSQQVALAIRLGKPAW
jgi:hypothetical protein